MVIKKMKNKNIEMKRADWDFIREKHAMGIFQRKTAIQKRYLAMLAKFEALEHLV